ncbi:MAG: IPExxxVDY family protein [Flavobacteriaceae bacterium]|nr:IPExxxVDY family protein [Eudoraea sp.]RZV54807.1 MAG: IPExxxVDY family protein [Flavobacteriaceae bacterium]
MVTTHKIFDDFNEETFALVALHSSLEDYAMVYALNNSLKTQLKRSRMDLDISENFSFPFFEWKDALNHRTWTLITNCSSKEDNTGSGDLFQDEISYTTHYLIPEHREVDYFLKIEQDDNEVDEAMIEAILGIPEIITAYHIKVEKLKSKINLIF